MSRVAILGLGAMGAAMASRLSECGIKVMGWDLCSDARRNATLRGLDVAASSGDAIRSADVILTSLPNSDAVTAAWLGEAGVVALAPPSAVCVELSTVDPQTMRSIGSKCSQRDLAVLDCPVSGGPLEAKSGSLVLLIGGEEQAIQKASPILRVLGGKVISTGDVGTAKAVKLVNNMMAMGNLLVACEAFSVGTAAGVAPHTLFDALTAGGGQSKTFSKRFPYALRGDFEAKFKMELAAKDLSLGCALAREQGVPVPVISMVREFFNIALAQGYGEKDVVALLSMYEGWKESSMVRG